MLSTQLKVTLPIQLYDFVQAQTQKFGLSISGYLKHLVLEDVKNMEMPEFKLNQKNEAIGLEAIKDYKNGKTRKIKDVDAWLNDL